jgi:hypothetical protein
MLQKLTHRGAPISFQKRKIGILFGTATLNQITTPGKSLKNTI